MSREAYPSKSSQPNKVAGRLRMIHLQGSGSYQGEKSLVKIDVLAQMLNAWPIYLHLGSFGENLGKYTLSIWIGYVYLGDFFEGFGQWLHLGALGGSLFWSDSHRPNATKQYFDLNFPLGKSLNTLTLQIFLLSGTPKQQLFNGFFNCILANLYLDLGNASWKSPNISTKNWFLKGSKSWSFTLPGMAAHPVEGCRNLEHLNVEIAEIAGV